MATNCLSSVEIYDPITNKITFGPELPFDICGHGKKNITNFAVIL